MSSTQASINAADTNMLCAVPFTKMQALGNDFVFVHAVALSVSEAGRAILADLPGRGAALARRLCDRHFGIGADGLIIVRQPMRKDCQVSWMYFNSDGSLSAMCGNGLRCLGWYAVQNRLVETQDFAVETEVGAVWVRVLGENSITTDLGEPILLSTQIPVGGVRRQKVVRERHMVEDRTFAMTCVSMGNPHCVIFDSNLAESDWLHLAPKIQQLSFFPQGVNVEFVEVQNRQHASVFVWERGCGPTLACASGAAAVLVAGVLEERLDNEADIALPGGTLKVSWSDVDNRVRITGAAHVSYRGVFDLEQYKEDLK